MPSRAIEKIVATAQQLEGGGFLVRKALGGRALPNLDPFLMLDHLGPVDYKPGEALGAPDHPHRGFETVSYIIEGKAEHKDSAGNTGILGPGWVQWMTAGKGVVHSEMPTKEIYENGGRFEAFQLWVNLPKDKKMISPRYQDTPPEHMPIVEKDNGKVKIKIIAGSALGASSSIKTHTPILYLDVSMEPGGSYSHPLADNFQGFVYCWRGKGHVGSADVAISMGQLGVISSSQHGDCISVRASSSEGCKILIICGEPIGEPIVQHGPFVMNTEEEIEQAIDDYRNGRLGSIPGADERYSQTEAARQKQKKSTS